jgi:hypothetical protein
MAAAEIIFSYYYEITRLSYAVDVLAAVLTGSETGMGVDDADADDDEPPPPPLFLSLSFCVVAWRTWPMGGFVRR